MIAYLNVLEAMGVTVFGKTVILHQNATDKAGESNLGYLTWCILMTWLTSVAILVPLNTNNIQLRY